MCSAELWAPWPSGRQDVPCTPVCAAHPGLLGAKLGSVQPFVRLSLASWAPSRALYTFVQLSLASWAPLCDLYTRLYISPWLHERLPVPCTSICTVRPDLLLDVWTAICTYTTASSANEASFELPQQLPILTCTSLPLQFIVDGYRREQASK